MSLVFDKTYQGSGCWPCYPTIVDAWIIWPSMCGLAIKMTLLENILAIEHKNIKHSNGSDACLILAKSIRVWSVIAFYPLYHSSTQQPWTKLSHANVDYYPSTIWIKPKYRMSHAKSVADCSKSPSTNKCLAER